MSSEVGLRPAAVPTKPVGIEEAIEAFPVLRQSLLAKFDDCELSTLFDLRYANGWTTGPSSRGTIFHRFAAECLREMQRTDAAFVPVSVALAILEEVCYQHNVPPEDIVRVPFRELGDLEMAAKKFAKDNRFNVRKIIDVERRLAAELTYTGPNGELIRRTLTGQIDALIADEHADDEAVVIDWKTTWALPPERDPDAEDPGLSYHGFFQQQLYAWLVMKTFPAINAVTLREFYVYRTQARPARVTRQDLPQVEQRLKYLVASLDRAVMAGQPKNLKLATLEKHGSWKPSPGHHCRWCPKAHHCPIDDDYRGDGGVQTMEDAARLAGARQVMKASIKNIDAILKPFAELHGPIPLKRAKGRMVLGFRKIKGGLRWSEFTPTEADRPTTEATEGAEIDLKAAMQDATRRARALRDGECLCTEAGRDIECPFHGDAGTA